MKIPKFLFGGYKEVKQRCEKKLVPRLRDGAALVELPDEWLDTRETDGLLLINDHVPELGTERHFHCAALMAEACSRRAGLSRERYDQLFFETLEHPWSFLGVFDSVGYLARHEDRHKPFLAAAVRHWQAIEAEGSRYSLGGGMCEAAWQFPSNVHFLLARAGVPNKRMDEHLPPGGLAALVAEFKVLEPGDMP